MSYRSGIRAEHYFMGRLNDEGIPFEFHDDWYDLYLPSIKEKLEIKSCMLIIKFGNKRQPKRTSLGRFDFTSEENRIKQFKENIWVALIVRYNDEFMVCGLCRAKKLEKKRYITLRNIRELNLISFTDWVNQVELDVEKIKNNSDEI